MDDKIIVACDCGKKYRVGPEKIGHEIACKECGGTFVAEAQGVEVEATPQRFVGGDVEPSANPAELMSHITSLGFTRTLVISIIAHVILVGVTSVAFVQLCLAYGTTDPRAEVRRVEKEKEDEKREAARTAEREKLKAEAEAREAAKAKEEATAAAAAKEPEREKTPVEKRVEETSDERPTTSTMSLDAPLDLE